MVPRLTGLTHKLHGFGHWRSNRSNQHVKPPNPLDLPDLQPSARTSETDVAANAASAAADVRKSIDHQVKSASEFDTKLSALVTVVGTAAAIVAAHLVLDRADRIAAFVISAMLVGLTVGLAFYGLRPRAASFGADPDALRALVTDRRDVFERELLNGLVSAYTANRSALESKADTYQQALLAFFVALLSIGPLLATGALQ